MAKETKKQEEKVDPKAAAKEAAAQVKAEKKAAAEAKEQEKAKKEKAKAAEKAEKEAAKAAEKEKRDKIKGGPGKCLRSLIARIKYMRYMDKPSSELEGVEALEWELRLTTTEGTTITVKRGSTLDEIEVTIKEQGKKAVTEVHANDDDTLQEVFGDINP